MIRRTIVASAFAALLMSSTAHAAPKTDLALSIAPPSGAHVYETGRYNLTVNNLTAKSASSVSLTIQLPPTHTSPSVYILGTLGARDSRCSVSGTTLSCNLGTLAGGASTVVFFDIALPYSAAPLVVSASVSTTTPETTLANNNAQHTASPLTYSVSMTPPETAINRHCTGQGLTSFFECELFPSSISEHTTIFNGDGSISFVDAPSGYTGVWSRPTPDHLQFEYYEGTDLVAEFDGYGVDGSCFEGTTLFPNSAYMSMYEVCLQ
ncbi:MAG: hypothetical protein U0359_09990 [Byssovorax sp.]